MRHKLSKQLTTHRRSSNFYKLAQNLAVHVVSLSYAVGLHSTHRHRPKEFTSIQRRYFVYSQAIGLMAYHFLSRVNSRSCMQHAILFYQFCLSLRLSVQCLFCSVSKRRDISAHFFTWYGHLLFPSPPPLQNSKGKPFSEGVEYKGVGFFLQISPFIFETV